MSSLAGCRGWSQNFVLLLAQATWVYPCSFVGPVRGLVVKTSFLLLAYATQLVVKTSFLLLAYATQIETPGTFGYFWSQK